VCRAPTRQEIARHREANVLAEKAQVVRLKAFYLFAKMGGATELGDAEIRLRGSEDRALRSVDEKEPPFDEVRKVAARPTQLPKDIEQTTP
jgi:hypothetical protein